MRKLLFRHGGDIGESRGDRFNEEATTRPRASWRAVPAEPDHAASQATPRPLFRKMRRMGSPAVLHEVVFLQSFRKRLQVRKQVPFLNAHPN